MKLVRKHQTPILTIAMLKRPTSNDSPVLEFEIIISIAV